jgi:hypothetical protein
MLHAHRLAERKKKELCNLCVSAETQVAYYKFLTYKAWLL